jgi:hypothetical protein
VTPADVRSAFAQAAAEDGIVLGSRSFDWLCEQGHVGLDPALVNPVTAALEALGAIYACLQGDISVLRASRENLLLPVDLVHGPTGTVIEVDDSSHFTSFRLAALELYPADVSMGSTSTNTRIFAALGAPGPTASPAASPPRASGSAVCSGNGRTTMHSLTLPLRPCITRP